MKFLLLTREFPPNVIGGVAYHAYNLAHTLTENHDVTVLTTSAGDHTDNLPLNHTEVIRLDCPTRGSPRFWFDRAVRTHLENTDLLDGVDVIHSHEYVRFDHLDTDVPTILKVHFNIEKKFEFFPLDEYHPAIRPLVAGALDYGIAPLERSLARQSLEAADGRIFISELTERLRADRATKPNRVVYNGVDCERFAPGETDDNGYYLFVGGTQHRKGYRQLLDASKQIDRELKIAGAERPDDESIPENVEFLGHVPQSELPERYRNASALVHPALYEPFGNIVLESLACGTPVVVSNPEHCGAAEILSEDVGTTIDPTDDSLHETLRTFDPTAYDTSDCRALAEQYTWGDVADETVAFARELLD
ncbi:glycosyltransferase family 4 protein [Haloarcula amylovorans]|uniref:glycosyltransferase family 4 protein n=1 Tax=Haloarcula amylovorans TaxID=2562280 RepID=UPI001431A541|nr:glycosyltransferase family 4 protein [Halomicroarcula amylolytica]